MNNGGDPPDGPPMAYVNRCILVVRPCQPFVDWVRSLEDVEGVEEGEVRYSLEEARAIPTAYLVPYAFDHEPVRAWVRDNCDMIFETELAMMSMDPEVWPTNRTVEVFEEWFDLDLLDAPIDLVAGPFHLADADPDERA